MSQQVAGWKPNPFEAKYPGRCTDCHAPIEAGDLVCYTPDDDLVHENCVGNAHGKPRGAVCTECFMEQSLSGECGCTR